MILVVGAGGQLGTAAVRQLMNRKLPVGVFVRREDTARRFEQLGCRAFLGDITRPSDLTSPLAAADAIVATVNSAMPSRPGDTIERIELEGYRNLLEAARASGVCRQFVYVSTTAANPSSSVPLFRAKYATEQAVQRSGLEYTIFRFPAFLDVWIPMMGIARAVAGADNPTVARDFAFARSHLNKIGDSVERKGVIHIAGNGLTPQAAIAVDDCASLIAASVNDAACLNRTLEITGPVAVTAEDVAKILERFLQRPLKRRKTPAWLFALLAYFLRSNPAAANLMAISRLSAVEPTPVAGQDLARMLGVQLTTPEQWLLDRLSPG